MTRRAWNGFTALALVALAVGCATNRSVIIPANPLTAMAAAPVTKSRAVLLRSVTDERIFEESPKDPSIPSLGFGGAAKASTELKARAIGRKRNTFGQAMGDVLLEQSATVTDVVVENLTAALKQAGYKVTTDAADAGQRPLVIDVHIKQFWCWFQPGFTQVKLHADITTDLEISELPEPISVSIRAAHGFQIANDDSWIQTLEQGLQEYRGQVVSRGADFPS
jgi:hypothetical protein